MSAQQLKVVMQAEKKRTVDIASELQISPNTVSKYLRGEPVSRVIQAAIEAYLARKAAEAEAKAAAG